MKILIVGPKFHNFNEMISRGFNKYGHETDILAWPDPQLSYFGKLKIATYKTMKALGISKEHNLEKIRNDDKKLKSTFIQFNKRLIHTVSKTQPDILLVLKGNRIFLETLRKIKSLSNTILVLWAYDSALKFQNVLKGGKYYDLFYTFEPTDIPVLQSKYKINAKFLPMAYDPSIYHKLSNNKKQEIDISFVGSLRPKYYHRIELLDEIISRYKDRRIEIWGPAWTVFLPSSLHEYLIKRRHLAKVIHNMTIPPEIVNEIYNNSKICLNIHHKQSKAGLNPRTFEILGAGCFELVDYKEYLEKLFRVGKEIECYKTKKELIEKLDYYLENDKEREKIAKKGHKAVQNSHTYVHRVKIMIEDVEMMQKY